MRSQRPPLLLWLNKTCWHLGRWALLCMLTYASLSTSSYAAMGIAEPPHEPAMLWPLLPGESLQSLAKKLYPQSPILQQRFVQQALTYSRHRGILLQAHEKVDRAQLIAVPDAESMHTVTHRIKKAEEPTLEIPTSQGLMLSMQITSAGPEKRFVPLLPSIHPPRWAQQLHWPQRWPTLDLPDSWQEAQRRAHDNSQRWLHQAQGIVRPALQQLQQLAVRARDNYLANTHRIQRTPLHALPAQPHLALIVASAVLLMLLSIAWGLLARSASTK